MFSVRVCSLLVLFVLAISAFAKKEKTVDPRECEVCINNLEEIDKLIPKDKKNDKAAVREAIGKHCTKSGFGSTWKANEDLTNPRDVKMCYYFEPIKEAVSTPFATGMPKAKVCQRLKKENPEICEVKYPLKVEKKEGEEKVNYTKMKVKDLRTILTQRGITCTGCTEKHEFVKKCEETEHLEL